MFQGPFIKLEICYQGGSKRRRNVQFCTETVNKHDIFHLFLVLEAGFLNKKDPKGFCITLRTKNPQE